MILLLSRMFLGCGKTSSEPPANPLNGMSVRWNMNKKNVTVEWIISFVSSVIPKKTNDLSLTRQGAHQRHRLLLSPMKRNVSEGTENQIMLVTWIRWPVKWIWWPSVDESWKCDSSPPEEIVKETKLAVDLDIIGRNASRNNPVIHDWHLPQAVGRGAQ